MAFAATSSPVLIIGAGLLGASIGLRLRSLGIDVYLEDASPIATHLAADLGAGSAQAVADPALVVVAVPPDVTPGVICAALDRFPYAVVTDVASVKEKVADAVRNHPGFSRWVGSHPMAGRERSGAIAADADLFVGRPWIITAEDATDDASVTAVRNLAHDVGATVKFMSPAQHDHAVAVVSHMPQLMSSLVAGALAQESLDVLDLSGQGLRDVTRIAESDPLLWTSIVAGNRVEIAGVLRKINSRLGALIAAIDRASGGLDTISSVIKSGNDGVGRIPGKHGGAPTRYAEVIILVPDKPGELGRLFSEIGEIGINIEDFMLEHSADAQVGRALISVMPAAAHPLEEGLEHRGWRVVSSAGKTEVSPVLVAIDGPSGSGKSTASKRVANDLGLAYLDTGAMYRAATWWALHRGIDLDDQAAVLRSTESMPLDMPLDPNNQTITCNGIDITAAIRESDLSKVVSKVATNLAVREELNRRQRIIIDSETQHGSFSQGRGIVAEGRDITTVVAPDADVRVLLTASQESRLTRRALEVRGSAGGEALAATRDEVIRRDEQDSTVVNFMTAEDGVTTIDSSNLSFDEVVEAIKHVISEAKND